MNTLFRNLLPWLLLLYAFPALAEKEYDFEFKGMDLKKVVGSIARLEKKSVLFSKLVESREIDVSLQHVTAELALRLILKNYGYFSIDEGTVLHVMATSERAPSSNSNQFFPLRHVLARDIEDNVKTFLGGPGTVSVNEQRNAIVISAPEELLPKVRALIEELDQENSQVYIEAKIVETTTNFSRSLGLQWGPTSGNRVPGVSLSAPGSDSTFMAGVANIAALNAQLMLGESKGLLKVLSSPKISTLNGVAASINASETFSIRTVAAVGATMSPGNIPGVSGFNAGSAASFGAGSVGASTGSGVSPTGQFGGTAQAGLAQVSSGILLRVTPYIVSDEQVRLQLQITKSDPDTSQAIDGIPGIISNSASTWLTVKSGQLASIGGLITHRTSNSQSGTPFLSKIPLLGGLFHNNTDQKNDEEMLIFLTPTIYHLTSDGAAVDSVAGGKPIPPARTPASADARAAEPIATK